jgi:NAD/NADP transhydrogenase beta subunit
MSQSVSLKQFLRTHKPLSGAEDCLQVLSDSKEVLWVPGYGMSEKLRVFDLPTHRLRIEDS